ncbi:MAG: hypothetical protein ISS71_08440 [Phycisphaerae bacterium]|nr:hypothetical protein [Phycisphaerae bacterium]
MKQSPQEKNLEAMLRSTKLVVGGFMGTDARHPFEVVEQDTAELERLGLRREQVARRMQELTERAKPRLGNWVEAQAGKLRVKSEDFKGVLTCPWPHPGVFEKRITTAERLDTGQKLSWTDLNIHMIESHGFFEGRGAFFRIEPGEAVQILFEGLTLSQK